MKKYRYGIIGTLCIILIAGSCQEKDSPEVKAAADGIEELVALAGSAWDEQEVYTDEATQTIYMDNCGIPKDFSFTGCLRGLSLSESQLPLVQRSLKTYDACSDQAMKRIRAIHNELKEKYKTKYQRLWNAFQEGTITREEFKEGVAGLRAGFKAELRRMHLSEKLHDALLICLRGCFSELREILTDRQWNAFKECYRQL